MPSSESGGFSQIVIQFLLLVVGIALILSNQYWNKGPAVIASGIFFINLFWLTMVLSYDLKIWSLLRNTAAGGLFMIGIIVINLLAVIILALFSNYFFK
jgi:amino acid permease